MLTGTCSLSTTAKDQVETQAVATAQFTPPSHNAPPIIDLPTLGPAGTLAPPGRVQHWLVSLSTPPSPSPSKEPHHTIRRTLRHDTRLRFYSLQYICDSYNLVSKNAHIPTPGSHPVEPALTACSVHWSSSIDASSVAGRGGVVAWIKSAIPRRSIWNPECGARRCKA